MGDLVRSYRAWRGDLPEKETWDAIDLGPRGDAAFIVGRVQGEWPRMYWRPQVGAAPHALVAGRTRLGKTSLLKAWAMIPLLQNRFHGTDWLPTIALDPKATGSFAVAEENGAEVIRTLGAIKDRLQELWQMAEARNRRLGKIVVERVDRHGVIRPYSPEKVYDLTREERAEHGMQPLFVVLEELRDFLGEGDQGTSADQKARAKQRALAAAVNNYFTQLLQKAGSAGIHVGAGVQQPRADIVGSFARDQMAARILVGRADSQTVKMVTGSDEEAKRITQEADVLMPGHGYAVGISDKRILERVYIPYFDLAAYSNVKDDPDRAPDPVTMREISRAAQANARPETAWTATRGALAGPFARTGLRVAALRGVTGPVDEGPFHRRRQVTRDTWAASDGTCSACGRAGYLEVDHIVPRHLGGEDATTNTRLLCKRPGRLSCHQAKTSMELSVLAMRRRVGTAPGPKPVPIIEWIANAVRLRPAWWWGLWAALIAGVVFLPRGLHEYRLLTFTVWIPHWAVLLDIAALVVLGPVLAWELAKASRRDLRASPDGSVDPSSRRSPAIEILKSKGGRKFRDRLKRKHHERMTAATFGRHYLIRVLALSLTGWASWWLVPTAFWMAVPFA